MRAPQERGTGDGQQTVPKPMDPLQRLLALDRMIREEPTPDDQRDLARPPESRPMYNVSESLSLIADVIRTAFEKGTAEHQDHVEQLIQQWENDPEASHPETVKKIGYLREMLAIWKNRKSSGCFIATAAWGDDGHEDVVVLRRFRDVVLWPTPLGRTVMRVYETISPPLAYVIARVTPVRVLVRLLVVRPARRLAEMRLRR